MLRVLLLPFTRTIAFSLLKPVNFAFNVMFDLTKGRLLVTHALDIEHKIDSFVFRVIEGSVSILLLSTAPATTHRSLMLALDSLSL